MAELTYLSPMPRNREARIGCIGAGFIMADCHLVAYRANGLNPVAIASRRPEQAQEVADRHSIDAVYGTYQELLADATIPVIDVAVPPDVQIDVIREAVQHPHIQGILAQKPLGVDWQQAKEIVDLCENANITLCVNQNMRFDHSVRACKSALDQNLLGDPVLATIDMRAIPHWMPWQQRQGWLTCRIMSIHHLDTMRYWFGDPRRVFASFRTDPRTEFPHQDGIGLYILEYDSNLRCQICDDVWAGPVREGSASDLGIRWRVEGTTGMAQGEIGWPSYPERAPSTIDWTNTSSDQWNRPRWDQVWFPDSFVGPMAELLLALENNLQPPTSGHDNLTTMALVDACYESARQHTAIDLTPT